MSEQFIQPTQSLPYKNFWQGERVRLRAIEPEDAETFFTWNFDSETARMVDYLWPPASMAATRAWAQKMATQEIKDDLIHCAIEDRQGNLIGLINSHSTNRRTGTFGYGIAVSKEYRGHGYGTEAVILLLRYFFEELRYQKVTVTVYELNSASIALHERLGFQREGRLRRMVYTHGRYYDEFFYGMTHEEFTERYGS
jgi:RimJ/RimL family protein N-acetyltransferase